MYWFSASFCGKSLDHKCQNHSSVWDIENKSAEHK